MIYEKKINLATNNTLCYKLHDVMFFPGRGEHSYTKVRYVKLLRSPFSDHSLLQAP